jgi:hypothetical protein
MLVWHVLRRRAFSSCDLRWRLAEMRYLLAACAAAAPSSRAALAGSGALDARVDVALPEHTEGHTQQE